MVWSRLRNHRTNLAKQLSEQKERYLAARRELNPNTTQVEYSHDPLYRDRGCMLAVSLFQEKEQVTGTMVAIVY